MSDSTQLRQLVKDLLESQLLAVLATHSQGQPHTSLLAFASTEDLAGLLFVTSRDTQKYSNALAGYRVAMLMDNRTNRPSDFTEAVAVTAVGTVEEVTGDRRNYLARLFLTKHPSLEGFLNNPAQALMEVRVDFYHIARFDSQEVLPIRGL